MQILRHKPMHNELFNLCASRRHMVFLTLAASLQRGLSSLLARCLYDVPRSFRGLLDRVVDNIISAEV